MTNKKLIKSLERDIEIIEEFVPSAPSIIGELATEEMKSETEKMKKVLEFAKELENEKNNNK